MLTGVLPFRGDSMAELMFKIANEPAPDIRFIRPDLPERLTGILATALHKQAEGRYQSGDQFASDLRALGVESAPKPGTVQVTIPPDLKREPAVDFAATSAIPVQDGPSSDERTVAMTRQDSPPRH
jgi:serine/threonine-protein kinase